MSFIYTKLNLCKGMRRKRTRQRTVLHTDFLSDWLILCLLIERERVPVVFIMTFYTMELHPSL